MVTDKKAFKKFKDQYSGSINGFFDAIEKVVEKRISEDETLNYADVYWEVMVLTLIELIESGVNPGFSLYVTDDTDKKNFKKAY